MFKDGEYDRAQMRRTPSFSDLQSLKYPDRSVGEDKGMKLKEQWTEICVCFDSARILSDAWKHFWTSTHFLA